MKFCYMEAVDVSRINEQDEEGNTPLIRACKEGNYNVVRACLEKGADRSIANQKGETAYQLVCTSGKTMLLKLFHTYG